MEEKNNPILVSVQQDYNKCTKLLYQHGYRIPKDFPEPKDNTTPGQEEDKRYEEVTKLKSNVDQVQKLMVFKAYANPFYTSLAFSEDKRILQTEKRNEDKKNPDVHFSSDDIKDLQKLDPLRRTLRLAEIAESLSNNLDGKNELKEEYNQIKRELEDFSHEILTNCSAMDEVETLLEHNPYDNDDDEDDDEKSNWQKALFEGRRKFVSHPSFQQNFRTQLYMNAMDDSFGNSLWSRIKWNVKYVPYSLFVSLIFPFIVLLDTFRDADLLFVSSKALKERNRQKGQSQTGNENPESENPPEGRFFSFFRQIIHIPVFRMIYTHAFQMIYLVLIIVMIWHRPQHSSDDPRIVVELERDDYFYVRTVVTGFALMLLVDDLETLFRRRFQFFESFWNSYNLCSNLLMVSGMLTQFLCEWLSEDPVKEEERPNMSGNHPMNIAVTLYSIAAGLEVFKTLRYLLLFDYLGPVVVCVTSVFKDVVLVLIVYVIIFMAHFVTLWTLFKPYSTAEEIALLNLNATTRPKFELVSDDLSTRQKMLSSMMWRIIFADNPDSANIKRTDATDDNFSVAFAHTMGMAVWTFYQAIVSILMLNVLIAIMNTTYAKVWANVDQEWKSQRTYYQVLVA